MTRTIEVVVIAPAGVSIDVKSPCRHSTLVFSSVDEFERWHRGELRPVETIERHVAEALERAGARVSRVRPAMDWLSRQQRVPSVKEFSARWSSRRSFFRTWKTELPLSPDAFLRLVRRLHAESLLRRGMHATEVARVTGFRTVRIMRSALCESADNLSLDRNTSAGRS
jgi:methylphosphotriester-DNA--protein-cysteine methyltransferase